MIIHTYWRWDPYGNVPELMVSCDEFTMDANPNWWEDECSKARADHPESDWRVVNLKVPDLSHLWDHATIAATARPEGDE